MSGSSQHPLDVIAAAPPDLDVALVSGTLARGYGLEGVLEPLVSERDQNFRLTCANGERFVVKIANRREPSPVTQCQVEALRHVEEAGCPVAVPRVVPDRSGALTRDIEGHLLRVVTFLPGRPVEDVPVDEALGLALGRSLAQLDVALQGFSHPGESPLLMWDMQRAAELRDLIGHVGNPDLEAQLGQCLDDFERHVLPEFPALRTQVIHNDLNLANVLVDPADSRFVTGIIDFGDMLRAPLVVDAAIAASYFRQDDPGVLRQFLAGYESVLELEPLEKALLFDLVRMRLVATILIMHWRSDARGPEDPYLRKALAERSAERFFGRLTALGRAEFNRRYLGN